MHVKVKYTNVGIVCTFWLPVLAIKNLKNPSQVKPRIDIAHASAMEHLIWQAPPSNAQPYQRKKSALSKKKSTDPFVTV